MNEPEDELCASNDEVISLRGLTKDYGHQRGIFDLSFDVHQGEVFGLVGTNGSGKTTTIRSVLGFIKSDAGTVNVKGLDTWTHAAQQNRFISYVPGEIQFPAFRNADTFFDYQARLLGPCDRSRRDRLIKLLHLDTSVNPRKMSKGMKQKTVIIAAFMSDNPILILDEPTTGLDPVMRDVFIELIKEEKHRGKTIFMSTHIFEEIEEVCHRVAVIHDGHMVDILTIDQLESYRSNNQDQKRVDLETHFKEIFRKEA